MEPYSHSNGTTPAGMDPVEAWIKQARQGSPVAFDKLFNAARPRLSTVAMAVLSSALRAKFDAADLLQETALMAHQNFADFRGHSRGELFSWLGQMLVNKAFSMNRHYRRTRKRDYRLELSLDQSPEVASSLGDKNADPESSLLLREHRTQLAACISRLPKRMRLAVALRHEELLRFSEIGIRLGCSAEAARKVYHRAIVRLRRQLHE